jgi:hypothetical protein
MSSALKDQGSELEAMIDKGSWVVLVSARLAFQLVHVDDDKLGSALIEPDKLEGTGSGGGVTNLRGGDFKYDLIRISQNAIKSDTSSIMLFNLIPYLNGRE